MKQIIETLKKKDFEIFVTDGCFDVAARRENLFLLKVLLNLDCLSEENALSLRSIAYFLSAYPFVVAMHTTRYKLKDEIIYRRFGIPVINPNMVETIVDEGFVAVESSKGKFTVEVDNKLLREKRIEKKYSLKSLAEMVGITKKSLYEIEHNRVKPKIEHVEKLEKLLETKLRLEFRFEEPQPVYLEPKDNFGKSIADAFKKMGIEYSSVTSGYFDIIGKEKKVFVAGLYKRIETVLRKVDHFKRMEKALPVKSLFIIKKPFKEVNAEIPIICERELKEATKEDFRKILH